MSVEALGAYIISYMWKIKKMLSIIKCRWYLSLRLSTSIYWLFTCFSVQTSRRGTSLSRVSQTNVADGQRPVPGGPETDDDGSTTYGGRAHHGATEAGRWWGFVWRNSALLLHWCLGACCLCKLNIVISLASILCTHSCQNITNNKPVTCCNFLILK